MTTTITTKERNDWKGEIMIAIPRILVDVREQGRKPPSLRGLYYILLDKGLIKQKSDDHYHTLSVNTTEARLELNYNYDGKPEWDPGESKGPAPFLLEVDALRDESKPSHQDIPDQTPEEFVTEEIVQRIRHPERYYIPNRWYKQEHFVIVVIEKSALFEDFLTIIEQEDLQVMLFALGGYAGTTDVSNIIYDILTYNQQRLNKKVHILYFGDYDGHGLKIDKDVEEKLHKTSQRYLFSNMPGWCLNTFTNYKDARNPDWEKRDYTPLPPQQQDFSFERLAITGMSQIEEHRLQVLKPMIFEDEEHVITHFTKGKKKDFAKKDFALIHPIGDGRFQYFEVEVDGIVSSRWEIVKRLVFDNVNKYWNPQIWESVKADLSLDRIKEQLEARVSLLKQEDKDREFSTGGEEEE